MITLHHWSGWWEPNENPGAPTYGPCETALPGKKGICGKPRHHHEHSLPARRQVEVIVNQTEEAIVHTGRDGLEHVIPSNGMAHVP